MRIGYAVHVSSQLKRKVLTEYPNAEILADAPLVHHEWDCDGWAVTAKVDGTVYFFTTNHGGLIKMSLADGRKEMRDNIRSTQALLDQMTEFQGSLKQHLNN